MSLIKFVMGSKRNLHSVCACIDPYKHKEYPFELISAYACID